MGEKNQNKKVKDGVSRKGRQGFWVLCGQEGPVHLSSGQVWKTKPVARPRRLWLAEVEDCFLPGCHSLHHRRPLLSLCLRQPRRPQAAGVQALRVHEDREQEVPLGRRKPHTPPQPTHQRPPRRLRDRRGTPLKYQQILSYFQTKKNQKIPFKHTLDI